MGIDITEVLEKLKTLYPEQKEYLQAAEEIIPTLVPVLETHPEYNGAKILERFVEPERIISFKVCWIDDRGEVQINHGWRVQFNSAIGPYKGGLRFHPSVNEGILKFLGLEQVLKNSLTSLVTFLGQTMAEIVGAGIVVEQVLGIPGLGRFLVLSISHRDYPVVQTIVVILAFWVVLTGTLADLINQWIDPRLRLGGREA